jgi:cullin-associated NEDD8-dissociated protein 1
MSMIMASCGGDADKVMPIFHDRLGNTTSCQSTLVALTYIANATNKVSLSYIISNSVSDMCKFMRQTEVALKHKTVKCLEALVRSNGQAMSIHMDQILEEVSPHIGEGDLYLAHLVLNLLSSALASCPSVAKKIPQQILPGVIALVQSSVVQGVTLKSLIRFFVTATVHGSSVAGMSFKDLMETLRGMVSASLTQQAFRNLSQCIAGITVQAPEAQQKTTVAAFIVNVKTPSTSAPTKTVALLSMGEIGRCCDLSGHADIDSVIFAAFKDGDNGVRQAAAYALGSVAVGNNEKFLGGILKLLAEQKDQQYGLLMALKETINASPVEGFPTDSVAPMLFERAQSDNESVRAMVAECLGLLARKDQTGNILGKMTEMTVQESDRLREVVITALRMAFVRDANWENIEEALPKFMKLLKDPNLAVRQQAFNTLNSLYRVRFKAIASGDRDGYIAALYADTVEKKELQETLDYGDFKELVDKGLPLRRSAFEALGSLLEFNEGKLDLREFVDQIKKGLTDSVPSMQIVTMGIFMKMAKKYPSVIVEHLDDIPAFIMSTVKKHIKGAKSTNKTASAVPKECLKMLVKMLLTFNRIPKSDQQEAYTKFFAMVMKTEMLKSMIEELKKEGTE